MREKLLVFLFKTFRYGPPLKPSDLNFFQEKNVVIVFGHWAKTIQIFFGLGRQGCQNCNQWDHRNVFRWFICFWRSNFFYIFGHWAKSFWFFVQNYPMASWKLRCTDPLDFSTWNLFLKKNFVIDFGHSAQNYPAYLRIFWKKMFFFVENKLFIVFGN